ncbi:hypothetical protein SODALDRAFT_299947 [Sodiomyces alkalinus F11]|uniref:FAD-binding FR-type domain-containing protein n=1 Tax=Sodiomyces alkalinus (strain CBS 110278 / VKM F-3762 / F11) TaxID=1314773 RepID=A0A3N2PMM3_SODAK|nr:hypothetical protein SODALDRAFT_299947 [Sodiomyces alkalinus F11]ROT35782.1 hypothetical protein SODALDRAFT_299947 [Sodiomyces alkalinus F11]
MGWPYQFLTLTPEEVQLRRESLDHYAFWAHLLGYMPILASVTFRVGKQLLTPRGGGGRGAYEPLPHSPVMTSQRRSVTGSWQTKVRILQWWLDDDVYLAGEHVGTKQQWVLGIFWFLWLLAFCIMGTGNDYLHFTKRLGIIAVSQFPLQYLLALKSFNPVAWALGSSHEALNSHHRALAQVINTLLSLHAVFYLNYFIQVGILKRRLFAPVVFAGVLAFLCLGAMMSTASGSLRRQSYRLFFLTHLFAAFAIPSLIYYHAPSSRLYITVGLGVFLVDLTARRLRTIPARASVETIPGTNLIKVVAAIPRRHLAAFHARPASHVYVSIPADTRPSAGSLLFECLFNPFTVAAVNDDGNATIGITLVARQRSGPVTKHLAQIAYQHRFPQQSALSAFPTSDGNNGTTKVALSVEGPYGLVSRRYANMLGAASVDRILLVAGGVGATFCVPLYRAIRADHPGVKVELVWALRGAGDATWAVSPRAGGEEQPSILDDDNVHIYLTGDVGEDSARPGLNAARRTSVTTSSECGVAASSHEAVEMSALHRDRRRDGRFTASHNRKRPDLRKIVDDVFRHGGEERVAVLVCGPEEMARELRGHVGSWVRKGRDVVWHNEGFDW